MSTVTVTPLLTGASATSADVNATATSWNSATAAGQIGSSNVRMEGIDRRSMNAAGNVVVADTEAAEYTQTTNSLAVTSAAFVVIPLSGGLSNMQTPAAIGPYGVSARWIIYASTYFFTQPIALTVLLPYVAVRLELSDDGGGTWTAIAGSTREFQMRATNALCNPALATPPDVPGISGQIVWAQSFVPTNAAQLFRATYMTTNTTVTFADGSISLEVLLQ